MRASRRSLILTNSSGMTVEISGPVWRTMTVAGTGFYGAAGLPPGHYDITVTVFGQPLVAAKVAVHAGKVATVDLAL